MELVKHYYKKGRQLRNKCAQIQVQEHYHGASPIFLCGRAKANIPNGLIIIPSPECFNCTCDSILSQFPHIDGEIMLIVHSCLKSCLEGSKQSRQKAIKALLLDLVSFAPLVHMNETCPGLSQSDNKSANNSLDDTFDLACKYLLNIMNANIVILALDDRDEVIPRMKQCGIKSTTCVRFLSDRNCNAPLLGLVLDAVSQQRTANITHLRDTNKYESHMTASECSIELSKKKILHGVLEMSKQNSHCGYVHVKQPNGLASLIVTVFGKYNLNRAMDTDEVYVRLLPEKEWVNGLSEGINTDDEDEEATEDPETESDNLLEGTNYDPLSINTQNAKVKSSTGRSQVQAVPTGQVVAILRRHVYEVAGRVPTMTRLMDSPASTGLSSATADREEYVLIPPINRRLPKLRVLTRHWRQLQGKLVTMTVEQWRRDSDYPEGRVLRVIGDSNNWQTEVEALLISNSIFPRPFSRNAMECLPITIPINKEPEEMKSGWKDSHWAIPEAMLTGREDLRGKRVVMSVDPPGCQDIDDAMHLHWLDKDQGLIEVGVSIADVCSFLKIGSALDLEAQSRSTTVYLTHRRIDMLPSLLSSDIASLHGHKDRLAITVFFVIKLTHRDGRPVTSSEDLLALDAAHDVVFNCPAVTDSVATATRISRTVIHSAAAMTYQQAHDVIYHGKDTKCVQVPAGQAGGFISTHMLPQFRSDLIVLTVFGRHLNRRRRALGALDLSESTGSQLKFALDASLNPTSVKAYESLEIHSTIEELMVLANESVAWHIHSATPTAGLMRIHPPPTEAKLASLCEFTHTAGLSISETANNARHINKNDTADNANTSRIADLRTYKQALSRQHANQSTVDFVTTLAIQSMNEARYVCSGLLTADMDQTAVLAGKTGDTASEGQLLGHFGLGLKYYTHFTSPIRRYADVVVHRQLIAIIESLNNNAVAVRLTTRPLAYSNLLDSVADSDKYTQLMKASDDALLSSRASQQQQELAVTRANDGQLLFEKVSQQYNSEKLTNQVNHGDELYLSSVHAARECEATEDTDDCLSDLMTGIASPSAQLQKPASCDNLLDDLLCDCGEENPDDLLDELLNDFTTAAPTSVLETMPVAVVREQNQATAKLVTSQEVLPLDEHSIMPYSTNAVQDIAAHLNIMNRRSKAVQRQCQDLFLALYFTSRVEQHEAVVFELRDNGFLAFVPAFGLKGMVHLMSKDNELNVNPSVLGLNQSTMSSYTCSLLEESAGESPELVVHRKNAQLRDNKDVTGGAVLMRIRLLQRVLLEVTAQTEEGHVSCGSPRIRLSLVRMCINSGSSQPGAEAVDTNEIVAVVTRAESAEQATPLTSAKNSSASTTPKEKHSSQQSIYNLFQDLRSRSRKRKLSMSSNGTTGPGSTGDEAAVTPSQSQLESSSGREKNKLKKLTLASASSVSLQRLEIHGTGRRMFCSTGQFSGLFHRFSQQPQHNDNSSSSSSSPFGNDASGSVSGRDRRLQLAVASLSVGREGAMARMKQWGEDWAEEEELPAGDACDYGDCSGGGGGGGSGALTSTSGLTKQTMIQVRNESQRSGKLKSAKSQSRHGK